ncbi:MAG: recombinase family protein [Streptosporangiaceae bacterium]
MKLVMYTRVSSKTQMEGYGLDAQQADCREWAKAHGHKIVRHCSDDAVSGMLGADAVHGFNLDERPGLRRALDALADGTADGLLTGKLDRLGRSVTVQEAMLAWVWRHGRPVFCADQGEILQDDPDDPMRTAMRQMQTVFVQLDKALAVKRMQDGRKAKAAAGRHAVGAYPFGYRGAGAGRERDAAPDPAEQQAVALITGLHAAGRSYRQIIAALETAGLAPRRAAAWSPATVRKIVLREQRGPSPGCAPSPAYAALAAHDPDAEAEGASIREMYGVADAPAGHAVAGHGGAEHDGAGHAGAGSVGAPAGAMGPIGADGVTEPWSES